MNAWSASTANENDMNKRNSCLHNQQNQEYQMLAQSNEVLIL